jgi:hypothetical protein
MPVQGAIVMVDLVSQMKTQVSEAAVSSTSRGTLDLGQEWHSEKPSDQYHGLICDE